MCHGKVSKPIRLLDLPGRFEGVGLPFQPYGYGNMTSDPSSQLSIHARLKIGGERPKREVSSTRIARRAVASRNTIVNPEDDLFLSPKRLAPRPTGISSGGYDGTGPREQ